jgi:hypothetical protein
MLLILAAILLPLCACNNKTSLSPATSSSGAYVAEARTWVQTAAAGDFVKAAAAFDKTLGEQLPVDKLEATWAALAPQAGNFNSIIAARTEKQSSYDIVYVTCEFENMNLDIKLVYDADGKVAGLYFTPSTAATEYTLPAYGDTGSFTESEITVGTGKWALPGTLTIPKGDGPFPAVILVHGSGPNDRDESIGGTKTFKDLAWGLASNGVAVLRYEKRTRQYQAECAAMLDSFTVEDEAIDDAVAAVALLTATKGIDSKMIFIAGHSLGGMLAPRISVYDNRVAGIIILAGATRHLEDLILEQSNYIVNLDGTVTSQEAQQIKATEDLVRKVKNLDITASDVIMGAGRAYWAYLNDYEPVEEAEKLSVPMLILQGERDYQVTMVDFGNWSTALSAKNYVTLKSYPSLNHLFVTGNGPSTPGEYNLAGNVAEVVVTDIAAWIKKQ